MRFLLVLIFFISACANNVIDHYPPLRFSNFSKLALNVGHVIINDSIDDQSDKNKLSVEHLSPISFEDALSSWAKDRIEALGGDNSKLLLNIKKAEILQQELPKTQGVKGAFTQDQEYLYKASLSVAFELINDNRIGRPKSELDISVYRSKTIAEGSSPADRERLLYNLVKELVYDFNREFDNNFSNYFNSIIYEE